MTSSNHSARRATNIDDEVELCRDDNCKIVGIHAVHEVVPLRGRPPKFCPTCRDIDTGKRIPLRERVDDGQLVRFCACGFSRP